MEKFWEVLLNFFKNFGTNLLEAVAVLLVGIIVIKLAARFVSYVLRRSKVEGAASSFILSLVKAALVLVLFFVILRIFNIYTTNVFAIIAASGLAIGLALQDSLSNVACGVILLFTKPFKAGDHVVIGAFEGIIKKIKITNTEILTFDNNAVTIPNSKVVTSEISNISTHPTRRLDMIITMPHDAEPGKVKATLEKVANSDARVLKNPAPTVVVLSIKQSFVEYRMRVWTLNDDYWDVQFNYYENILKTLKKNGMDVPKEKMEIYIKKEDDK